MNMWFANNDIPTYSAAQQIAIFNTFLCSKPSQREAHSRCTCPDRPLQSPFYLQKVHHQTSQRLNRGWIDSLKIWVGWKGLNDIQCCQDCGSAARVLLDFVSPSLRFIYTICIYLILFVYLLDCLFLCLVVFLIHVHVHKDLHGMISSCPHGWDWNPGTFHSNSLKLTEGWGEMNMFHFGSLAHCYVPVVFLAGKRLWRVGLARWCPASRDHHHLCRCPPNKTKGGDRWMFGAGGERRCWDEVFEKSGKHMIWGPSWIKLTTPCQGLRHRGFLLFFMSQRMLEVHEVSWSGFLLAFHWGKLDSEPRKRSLTIAWNLKSLT